MTAPTHPVLTEVEKKEIDHWIEKYPPDQKKSAVMSALRIVQEHRGWLTPPAMDAVAAYLDMPPIAVYEVASFYSMYDLKPVGRNKIYVCTNISCMLCGCDKIVHHLQNRLRIQVGETTADGKFSLKAVECLAACAGAPMMQVNKTYHEHLTPEKVDAILDALES